MNIKNLHISVLFKKASHFFFVISFSVFFFGGSGLTSFLGELDQDYELCEELEEKGDLEENEKSEKEGKETKISIDHQYGKLALFDSCGSIYLSENIPNYLDHKKDIPNPPP